MRSAASRRSSGARPSPDRRARLGARAGSALEPPPDGLSRPRRGLSGLMAPPSGGPELTPRGSLGLGSLGNKLQDPKFSDKPSFAMMGGGWASSGEDEWTDSDTEPEPEPEPELSRKEELEREIRAELEQLTLGKLTRKAVEAGIEQAEVTEAQDHDAAEDVMDAMITLLMANPSYRAPASAVHSHFSLCPAVTKHSACRRNGRQVRGV